MNKPITKPSTKPITKLIALFLTINIISLIFLLGPVQAFELNLESDKTIISKGEIVNFEITISIATNDGKLPLNNLQFKINGPTTMTCSFDTNGNIISGCAGVENIERLDDTTFGYGYNPDFGYGYGFGNPGTELKYKITLNTSNLPAGTYSTELKAKIGNKTFTEIGENLTIKSSIILGGSSSRKISTKTSETQLTSTGKLSVTPGTTYTFQFEGYPHKLTINKIENKIVYITIFSEPKNINLGISDITEVDINDDGKTDLTIDANFIGENSASLTINSEQRIKFKQEISNIIIIKETKSQETETFASQSLTPNKNLFNNPLFPIFLIIINLIMLELIIIARLIKRR